MKPKPKILPILEFEYETRPREYPTLFNLYLRHDGILHFVSKIKDDSIRFPIPKENVEALLKKSFEQGVENESLTGTAFVYEVNEIHGTALTMIRGEYSQNL